jgi:predicted  nucleic acid-binding Zn-ribbon protein
MILVQTQLPQTEGQLVYTATNDITIDVFVTNVAEGYKEVPYTKFPTQQDQQYTYQLSRSTPQHFYETLSIAVLAPGQTIPTSKSQYILYETQILHNINYFKINLSAGESIWMYSWVGITSVTISESSSNSNGTSTVVTYTSSNGTVLILPSSSAVNGSLSTIDGDTILIYQNGVYIPTNNALGGPNLLKNSTGVNNLSYWTATNGWSTLNNTKPFLFNYASAGIGTLTQNVDISGSNQYVIGGYINTATAGGACSAIVTAYDSSNNNLGNIATISLPAGNTWTYLWSAGSSPSNTSYLQVTLQAYGSSSGTNISFARIKLEPGSSPSAWTFEEDVAIGLVEGDQVFDGDLLVNGNLTGSLYTNISATLGNQVPNLNQVNSIIQSTNATIDSQLNLISDNISTINNSINNISSDINNSENQITNLSSDIQNINSEVSVLQTDVNNLSSDIQNINSEVSVLQDNISNLSSDILETNITLQNNINTLSSNLSSSINNINNTLQELYNIDSSIQSAFNSFETNYTSSINNALLDISNLSSDVSNIDLAIQSVSNNLTTYIQTIDSEINNLSSDINIVDNNINNLSSELYTLSNNLTSDINSINNQLLALSPDSTAYIEIANLSSDLSTLEQEIASDNTNITMYINSGINNLSSGLVSNIINTSSELYTYITDVNSNLTLSINSIESNINNISSDLYNLTTDIETLNSEYNSIENNLTSLSSEYILLNNNILNLSSNYQIINNDVTNLSSLYLNIENLSSEYEILNIDIENLSAQINNITSQTSLNSTSDLTNITNQLIVIENQITNISSELYTISNSTINLQNVYTDLNNLSSEVATIFSMIDEIDNSTSTSPITLYPNQIAYINFTAARRIKLNIACSVGQRYVIEYTIDSTSANVGSGKNPDMLYINDKAIRNGFNYEEISDPYQMYVTANTGTYDGLCFGATSAYNAKMDIPINLTPYASGNSYDTYIHQFYTYAASSLSSWTSLGSLFLSQSNSGLVSIRRIL